LFYNMIMIQYPFSLANEKLLASLEGRKSIFLDSNIWIDLANAEKPEGITAKHLLLWLVNKGLVFCPVSIGILLELFLQEYDSALRQAELMEKLSLNVTLRPKSEIWSYEINALLQSFLKDTLELSVLSLNREYLFGPAASYLGSNLSLTYSGQIQTIKQMEVASMLADKISKLTITDLVEMHKKHLPSNDWKKNFDQGVYIDMMQNRRNTSKGVRKNAREIEKQAILENEVVPTMLAILRKSPAVTQLNCLQRLDAYLTTIGSSASDILIKKLPSVNYSVEIQTTAASNPILKMTPNHFIDVENMIVAPVYADVFVARDGWVKSVINDSQIKSLTKATCLHSLTELITFCEELKSGQLTAM
jgi:hypothetical protein